MNIHSKTQRGVTLTGLLMACIVIALIALLSMKVVPEYIEYGKIQSIVKAMGQDSSLSSASVAEVRGAFDRRANIDQISALTGKDIEVTKDRGALLVTFAYTQRIPLFANISLVIDFEGSSAQ